jgi:acyl-CoA synthetase (AMP-forming)/AMP-acid ligase II
MGSYPEVVIEEPDHKLIVTALEERARKTPQHTWLSYANADWETKGYNTITYAQGARAVDKLAFWIDEQLGKAGKHIETIAYYGPNDPRYAFIVPASIKAGRRVGSSLGLSEDTRLMCLFSYSCQMVACHLRD